MATRRTRTPTSRPADLEAVAASAFRTDLKALGKLLDAGVSPPGGLGALIFDIDPDASEPRQVRFARFLLERGADPDAVREDEPAIADAVARLSPGVVRLLLERGADANAGAGRALALLRCRDDPGGAAKLKLLVASGADLDARPWTALDENALMFALGQDPVDAALCRALIAAGIDLRAKDRHGATALDKAVRSGHAALAALIRRRGGRHGLSRRDRERPTRIARRLHGALVPRARSAHVVGLPSPRSVYATSRALGGRFPGCGNPPRHLVTLQLDELPFPAAVKRVGALPVVHAHCDACTPDDLQSYRLTPAGKLSPLGNPAPGTCRRTAPSREPALGLQLTATATAANAANLALGGEPGWLQGAIWPACDHCGLDMFFIVEIGDTDAMLYVFLCEKCRVTTTVHQRS